MTEVSDTWFGKILLLYTAYAGPSSAVGVAIENGLMETHFGRLFLTGTVPKSGRDWASGLRVAIAWDQVAHCIVFDSLKQYQESVAQAPTFWENKSEN